MEPWDRVPLGTEAWGIEVEAAVLVAASGGSC